MWQPSSNTGRYKILMMCKPWQGALAQDKGYQQGAESPHPWLLWQRKAAPLTQ